MKKLNEILINWNNLSDENSQENNIIQTSDLKESFKKCNMYDLDDDDDCENLKRQIKGLSIPFYYYDEEQDEWRDSYERISLFRDRWGWNYWGEGTEESIGPLYYDPDHSGETWKQKDYPQKLIPEGYWKFLEEKFNSIKENNDPDNILKDCIFYDLLCSVTYTFDTDPIWYATDSTTDIYTFFLENEYKEINKFEDEWGYNYLFQGKQSTQDLVYLFVSKKGYGVGIEFLCCGLPER